MLAWHIKASVRAALILPAPDAPREGGIKISLGFPHANCPRDMESWTGLPTKQEKRIGQVKLVRGDFRRLSNGTKLR